MPEISGLTVELKFECDKAVSTLEKLEAFLAASPFSSQEVIDAMTADEREELARCQASITGAEQGAEALIEQVTFRFKGKETQVEKTAGAVQVYLQGLDSV